MKERLDEPIHFSAGGWRISVLIVREGAGFIIVRVMGLGFGGRGRVIDRVVNGEGVMSDGEHERMFWCGYWRIVTLV